MGFHKRFVSRKVIFSYWKDRGIQGIHECMSADALMINSDCIDIVELYKRGEWTEINQLISKELLESGENLFPLGVSSTDANVGN
jgi:hypothetical protein